MRQQQPLAEPPSPAMVLHTFPCFLVPTSNKNLLAAPTKTGPNSAYLLVADTNWRQRSLQRRQQPLAEPRAQQAAERDTAKLHAGAGAGPPAGAALRCHPNCESFPSSLSKLLSQINCTTLGWEFLNTTSTSTHPVSFYRQRYHGWMSCSAD